MRLCMPMLFCVVAFAGLSGCASIAPVLAPSASVDPAAGYVAGRFTRMKSSGFAFIIKSTDGKQEFTMPLGEDLFLPTAVVDQTVAIKLPPGNYVIAQWITYATDFKLVMSRQLITNTVLQQPFAIKAGDVIHLGSYVVSVDWDSAARVTHLTIQPKRASQAEVQKAFSVAYPDLASQPFVCVLCVDTVGKGQRQ